MKRLSPIFCAALAAVTLLSGCDDSTKEVPIDNLSAFEDSCWTGSINHFGYVLIFKGDQARLYSADGLDDTAQIDDCTGRWAIEGDQFAIYEPENDDEPLCSYLWKYVNAGGIPTITLGDTIKLTQSEDAEMSDAPALAEQLLRDLS